MTYREIGISIRSAYTQGWPDDASRLAFRTETRKLFRDAGWQVEENRWTAAIVIRCGTEKTRCTCIRICSAA